AVYDPAPEACTALVERGAVACSGPAEVAARSELVLLVVVDDAQTRAAVEACLESAARGTVLALCASVRPGPGRGLGALRAGRGGGGGRRALCGGGPAEGIDSIRETVGPCGPDVVRVGDVGAGQVAKTANNILLWACIRADVEAMRLGRSLGVEPSALRAAVL